MLMQSRTLGSGRQGPIGRGNAGLTSWVRAFSGWGWLWLVGCLIPFNPGWASAGKGAEDSAGWRGRQLVEGSTQVAREGFFCVFSLMPLVLCGKSERVKGHQVNWFEYSETRDSVSRQVENGTFQSKRLSRVFHETIQCPSVLLCVDAPNNWCCCSITFTTHVRSLCQTWLCWGKCFQDSETMWDYLLKWHGFPGLPKHRRPDLESLCFDYFQGTPAIKTAL